jgi:Ni,Fe-hydrogenase III large subunit
MRKQSSQSAVEKGAGIRRAGRGHEGRIIINVLSRVRKVLLYTLLKVCE